MIANPEQIKALVREKYSYLGINKQQEVSRLLFKIAKRKRSDYTRIIECLPQPPSRFAHIKDSLLKRRYPTATEKGQTISA